MARNEKDQAPASARGQKVKVMQHGTMTGKTQLSGEKDPGQTAKPTTCFKPADFSEDGKRLAQADLLEGLNIASVFIRQHVHFALDHCLTTMTDALRPESDCIITGAPECLEGLEPVITENNYVLTVYSVPYTRFVGFWALVDCAWHWIDPPKPGEPAKMTNYKSDVDISMHTAYHIHHVTSKLSDSTTIGNFLNSFQTVRAAPARPTREGPTPNDASRGPSRSQEDDRVDEIRHTIAVRFKEGMRKEVRTETRKENKRREVTGRKQINISSSDSESSSHMAKPVKPIEAKAMPKQGETWRRKSDIPERSAAASSASASSSKPAENTAKERVKQTVKAPASKRETSQRAKEVFKDADRKFSKTPTQLKKFILNSFRNSLISIGSRGPKVSFVAEILTHPMMPCTGVIHVGSLTA